MTPELEAKLDMIIEGIKAEVRRSADQHGHFTNAHEAWAVLHEEHDELWDEIKANRGYMPTAETEAIQTGAMAVRYILDLIKENV